MNALIALSTVLTMIEKGSIALENFRAVVETARAEGRDLSDAELEMLSLVRDEIKERVSAQLQAAAKA